MNVLKCAWNCCWFHSTLVLQVTGSIVVLVFLIKCCSCSKHTNHLFIWFVTWLLINAMSPKSTIWIPSLTTSITLSEFIILLCETNDIPHNIFLIFPTFTLNSFWQHLMVQLSWIIIWIFLTKNTIKICVYKVYATYLCWTCNGKMHSLYCPSLVGLNVKLR